VYYSVRESCTLAACMQGISNTRSAQGQPEVVHCKPSVQSKKHTVVIECRSR